MNCLHKESTGLDKFTVEFYQASQTISLNIKGRNTNLFIKGSSITMMPKPGRAQQQRNYNTISLMKIEKKNQYYTLKASQHIKNTTNYNQVNFILCI